MLAPADAAPAPSCERMCADAKHEGRATGRQPPTNPVDRFAARRLDALASARRRVDAIGQPPGNGLAAMARALH